MDGLYHVWFSTKARKHVLEEEIAADVKLILREIAQRTSIRILEMEALADHAHLLVHVRGEQTLPSVIHQLKGASARSIFLKYPDLKFDLGHAFWQKGYGWRRISEAEVPAVRNYIRTQRERPLRHSD